MHILMIIIEILWCAIALMLCIENIDALSSTPPKLAFVTMVIFLIGAPFFLIANVLEEILSCIFPDNWE